LDLNKVYEVKYRDSKNVKKRYSFLKIFIKDKGKEDNSKINLVIPYIIDIDTKDFSVKIYLD
jgi:hypothetical protein